MEFKSARIETAENGYEVEICVKMKKPSREDIAKMDEPEVANVEGDSVMDYKKYVAKDLDEAIGYIKKYDNMEDKNDGE